LEADRQAAAQKLVTVLPEADPMATATSTRIVDVELPTTPSTVVLLDEPTEAVPEAVYARQMETANVPALQAGGDDLYRTTDFTPLSAMIDPQRFHDPSYDATLSVLVRHVLAAEAPIAETLLIQRIARVHGFQRAGRIIRDRVMTLTEKQHVIEEEPEGGRFIWIDVASQSAWNLARRPASDDDIRAIEDIALAELRAARCGQDAVDVARLFGVRRLSASARARIDAA
jgi:hypothetical protein